MRKHAWKVVLRAQPRPDGLERLGKAVRLVIDRADAGGDEEMETRRHDAPRARPEGTQHALVEVMS